MFTRLFVRLRRFVSQIALTRAIHFHRRKRHLASLSSSRRCPSRHLRRHLHYSARDGPEEMSAFSYWCRSPRPSTSSIFPGKLRPSPDRDDRLAPVGRCLGSLTVFRRCLRQPRPETQIGSDCRTVSRPRHCAHCPSRSRQPGNFPARSWKLPRWC